MMDIVFLYQYKKFLVLLLFSYSSVCLEAWGDNSHGDAPGSVADRWGEKKLIAYAYDLGGSSEGSLAFGFGLELWGADRCCTVCLLDDKEGYWFDGYDLGGSSEGSLAFVLELWRANRFGTVYFFLDDIKESKEVN